MSHYPPPPPPPPPGQRPLSYYPGDDSRLGQNDGWEEEHETAGYGAGGSYPQSSQAYQPSQSQPSNAASAYPPPRASVPNYTQPRNHTYPSSVPPPPPPSSAAYNPQHYVNQHNQHHYGSSAAQQPQQHPLPARGSSVSGPRPYNPASYQGGGAPVNTHNPRYGTENVYNSPVATNFSPNNQTFPSRGSYPSPGSQYAQSPQFGSHAAASVPYTPIQQHALSTSMAPRGSPRSIVPPPPPPPPTLPRNNPSASPDLPQPYQVQPWDHNRSSSMRLSPSLDYIDERTASSSPTRGGQGGRGGVSPSSSPSLQRQSTTSSRGHLSAQEMDRLQSRPLPGLPSRPFSDQDDKTYEMITDEERQQDELFSQIENAYLGNGSHSSTNVENEPPTHQVRPPQIPEIYRPDELSMDIEPSGNGRLPVRSSSRANGVAVTDTYDDGEDSDYEATAGLEAMRLDAEREASDELRRRNTGNYLTTDTFAVRETPTRAEPPTAGLEPPSATSGTSEELDFYGVDIGMIGGGFEAPDMSYGGEPRELTLQDGANHHITNHQSVSSRGSIPTDSSGYPVRRSSHSPSIPDYLPVYSATARVDESGTGGLAHPTLSTRKLSFDEGDESAYSANVYNNSQGLFPPDSYNEGFYPTSSSSPARPLPPPPSDQSPYLQPNESYSGSQSPNYPLAPEAYANTLTTPGGHVPRSVSLLSHTSTPQVSQPIRAKTDAEERKRQTMFKTSSLVAPDADYETVDQQSNLPIDLPSIPTGGRFQPTKLQARDFDMCTEPWALSMLACWLRHVTVGETELKEGVLIDGLVALFNHKNPNLNFADAETLAKRVVQDLQTSQTLIQEEEWLKFGPGTCSGVYYQLTGKGCYAPFLHDYAGLGKCYSYHCQRTVKKIDLDSSTTLKSIDWATFHKIQKEDVEGIAKKEVERQNVLHEIVQTEEEYMSQLNILDRTYRERIRSIIPPIIPPKNLESFIDQVFGKLDLVQKANADYLLPQLKYRQKEQGPWIIGFSDIFRDWIRKARKAYVEYSAAYPSARFRMGAEERKNVLFASFVEDARRSVESNRLGYDTYLKSPITRLQRYGLLLQTVHKLMPNESEEKTNLMQAIQEIKAVTLECDSRVAEMERKTTMSLLQEKLKLRPEIQNQVKLNLEHLGRELIYRGDLQRLGTNRFTWVETHAILFDHYLVLAKKVSTKDAMSGLKSEQYDVSKMPIPLQLLTLETAEDEPVVKSGLKGVTPIGAAHSQVVDPKTGRSTPGGSQGAPLSTTTTNNSLTPVTTTTSMVTSTNLEKDRNEENVLYPFKIKHLGQELYTLFATTSHARREWCDKIIEAKTKHAQSLFAQNAEPFRLRVLADSAFAYETFGQKNIVIKGSPLSRAVDEVERAYSHTARPPPVCRAKILCATTFHQNHDGKYMIAVGTDNGLYIAEMGNARGWAKVITTQKVTQVSVLEDFNLLLILSGGSLVAYHLDTVIPNASTTPGHANDSARKAPQKLSGSKDVGFFVTGRMKDRTLVFYKKREGISSTFKILEPILQKAGGVPSRTRSIFGHKGKTSFFRDFDDFYIGANCLALTLFSTTLSVSTANGFEVLNLDKKQTWSVPDLKAPHVQQIAQALQGQETLAMFRLDDAEFLCVYEECAVYVDKHGDVSRSVVMQFVGHAKAAALEAGFLVLFDNDFVEIRDAANGRLKQIVSGREVRCLDDGRGGTTNQATGGNVRTSAPIDKRTVKFAMQHPEQERLQLVLELVLNKDPTN